MARFLIAITLLTTVSQAAEFQWSAGKTGRWNRRANWSNGKVPTATDKVFIANVEGTFTRIRRTDTAAKTLSIGYEAGLNGSLLIAAGSLSITGRDDADGFVGGDLFVGRQGGTGRLVQLSGTALDVRDGFKIGAGHESEGFVRIDGEALTTANRLILTSQDTSRGTLVLCGSALVSTNRFRVGNGDALLRFVARSGETTPQLRTTVAPSLAGTLELNLRQVDGVEDEIILIRNDSDEPIQGYFDSVLIRNSDSSFYELSYHGGDGNDLTAVRSDTPIDTYDEWRAIHFSGLILPEQSRALADPDGDGACNATEYATGRSPLQPEGAWFTHTQSSSGTPELPGDTTYRARYPRRIDRTDVRLIPQYKPMDGIWEVGLSETRSQARLKMAEVEASLTTPDEVEVRIVAELIPTTVKPNVLFVIVDDLSNWVGCLKGHPQTLTPNIDRLAARGMLFRKAHAAATICNPSRVSLLTGVPPYVSGVYRNPVEMRSLPTLADAETIPSYFKKSGYVAVGSGKIFHDPEYGLWDEYWPSVKHYRPDDPVPALRPLNGITSRNKNFDWGPIAFPTETMGDHLVAQWVGARMNAVPDQQPFFAGCGFFRPHLPFFVPEKYFDRFEGVEVDLPGYLAEDIEDLPYNALQVIGLDDQVAVEEAGQWQNAITSYLASITFVDEQVGVLLDWLDSSPHGRNTIVVFMSDHGFMLGQKMHWRKQVLWRANTHIPLIIVAPGTTTPGTVCDQPVSLLDVFPTLVDLAGLPPLEQLHGHSLVDQLKDPSLPRAPVISTRLREQHAIYDGEYHLISHRQGQKELYDTIADPYELINLAEDPAYAATIERLNSWVPDDAP